MKIFSKCELCKKRRFIIKQRKITMPFGPEAKSKKLMCKKCQKLIIQAINESPKT